MAEEFTQKWEKYLKYLNDYDDRLEGETVFQGKVLTINELLVVRGMMAVIGEAMSLVSSNENDFDIRRDLPKVLKILNYKDPLRTKNYTTVANDDFFNIGVWKAYTTIMEDLCWIDKNE